MAVLGGDHLDAFSSVPGPSATGPVGELRDFFAALAARQAAQGLRPFLERVHGPADGRSAVLEARREGYARAGLGDAGPVSYLHGRPGDGLAPIGVQTWSVGPFGATRDDGAANGQAFAGEAVLREVHVAGTVGRLLETPERRLLWLSCVDGRDEQGLLGPDREEQARRMFARARAALNELGFDYRHVVRTWLALRGILQWYGGFNAVRSGFHGEQGIGLAGTAAMAPASTGVEGASNGEHCVMDLLAVEPRGSECSVELVTASGAQGDARAYGSSFSRAARLRGRAGDLLLVSGTASIGLDGQSLSVGDAQAQARHTLRAVGALLDAEGASPADIVSGTLYVTDRAALAAFQRAAAAGGAPSLPLVPVLADLCRPELLVEMDAIARLRPSAGVAERSAKRHDASVPAGRPPAA